MTQVRRLFGLATYGVLTLIALQPSVGVAASGAQGFVYSGRLLNSAGTAPMSGVVDFTFGIYSPTGCLLYEESQSGIDLSATSGLVSLVIGSGVAPSMDAVKRTANDPEKTMSQVFSNSAPLIVTEHGSNPGCIYAPAPGDVRKLQIIVTPLATGVSETLSPDLAIGTTPSAIVAETLQGLIPSSFVQTGSPASLTQANIEKLVSNVDLSTLDLHNHDARYAVLNSTPAFSQVTVSGAPTNSTDVSTKGYADTSLGGKALDDLSGLSAGESLQWDGTKWVTYTPGTGNGSVTGVSGTAPVSVVNGTTTPVISISQANGTTDGYLSTGDWSAFNAKTDKVGTPTNGNIAVWNGSGQLIDGPAPSTFAAAAHNQAWSTIDDTPTDLAGYGITDALVQNAGGTPSMQSGADASKPAGGWTAGRLYFATDTNKIYTDTGAAWSVIAQSGGGTVTSVTADA
ncbi:MAG TPA: hypothetical protein DCS07_09435, partial [Bdellovibrionales bacterium]|nr:hypothetical protein [Bdellovibrionales bacterium]